MQETKPETTHNASARMRQLDLIRGVAVFMVLGAHATWYPQFAGALRPFAHYWALAGTTAVDAFFVLSGFLIGGLLLQEWKRTGTINVKRFLLRRGFKIWPAYFSYILFIFAVYLIEGTHGSPQKVWLTFMPNFVHLQNYLVTPARHTWSLATEEHFYLLLPFLLIFIGQTQRSWHKMARLFCLLVLVYALIFAGLHALAFYSTTNALPPDYLPYRQTPWLWLNVAQMIIVTAWVCFGARGVVSAERKLPALIRLTKGLILLCLVMRLILKFTQTSWQIPETLATFASHVRLDIFFIGVALGYWFHFESELLMRWQPRRAWLGWAGLFCVALSLALPQLLASQLHAFSLTLVGLGYAGILLCCVMTPLGAGWLGRLMDTRLARVVGWVGLHSYSIYLWHVNPLRFYQDRWVYQTLSQHWSATVCWALTTGLYVVTTIAYGALLGKLIEFPMLRLRDRFYPAN